MVPILESTDAKALRRLLDRTPDDHGRIEPAVKDIIAAVRTRGDRALKEFARTFDKFDGHIELSPAEITAGRRDCPSHVRSAIRKAARHIRARGEGPGAPTVDEAGRSGREGVDNGSCRSSASVATCPAAATRCPRRC